MKRATSVCARSRAIFAFVIGVTIIGVSGVCAESLIAAGQGGQANSIPTASLMQPAELAKFIQGNAPEKPLIVQVGSRVLYEEAHIPGAEYIGPASSPEGREQLRQRLQSVSRRKVVILYCGCCPWSHCPNVKPAWELVQSLGFSNAKVLYVANNFGADWVDKGYPTAKGR